MTGIALAGWGPHRLGTAARLRRSLDEDEGPARALAVLVLAAAYAALLVSAFADVVHVWRGQPVPLRGPAWLLGINALLLAWRLAMRIAFTSRDYGWRAGVVAVPRFLIGNLVALAAAPRALATYLTMLVGVVPAWDKTEHEFPAEQANAGE